MDWGAQPTTYIVNDLSKKRSSRIDGPILSQKLGEDRKKAFTIQGADFVPKLRWKPNKNNKTRSSRHKFIIAGIAIGGPGTSAPLGYAYGHQRVRESEGVVFMTTLIA